MSETRLQASQSASHLEIPTSGTPLVISTGHQAITENSGAHTYPVVDYDYSPDNMGYEADAVGKALEYATQVFPEANLRVLSYEGSSAVVLEDDQNRVFKVMRDANRYSYYEDEMGALTLLNQLGIAPEPVIMVDAAEQYRTEPASVQASDTKRFFGEVPINRVEGPGPYPIIVMDKVEYDPVAVLSGQQKIEAFDKLLAILNQYGIIAGDTEIAVDKHTRGVGFVDLDGFARFTADDRMYVDNGDGTVDDMHPDLSGQEILNARVIHYLLGQFGPYLGERKVHQILSDRGIDGIHKLLIGKEVS